MFSNTRVTRQTAKQRNSIDSRVLKRSRLERCRLNVKNESSEVSKPLGNCRRQFNALMELCFAVNFIDKILCGTIIASCVVWFSFYIKL